MASPAPTSDSSGFTGYSQSSYDNATKFNPTTAVVIIVLLAGCFVLAFVAIMVRRCMRGDPTFPQSGLSPQSGTYNMKSRGLAKVDVDALPLVHSADLDEKHDHECPVCLANFEPEETLRLLPSCKHVFHRECIDAWFDSHSTCPLCRASLVGDETEKTPAPGVEQVAPGAPVASIYEASEDGDSDVEVHGGAMHGSVRRDAPLEESRTAIGAISSGEDDRSSARGTLFRNSESFKRAARGVEAYENAAAEAASDKNSSFRKPPLASANIHRSPSLSADLISLRKLLMGADQNANASLGSSRWFARAKSLELASRDRAVQNEYSREPSRDEWVTIDLETGRAAAAAAASVAEPSSSSESWKGPAPERSWSDRFSLSSLKSLKGIAILSRSTSDVSSRHTAHLPV